MIIKSNGIIVWINVQCDTSLPRNFCFRFLRLVDVVFLTPDICMVSSCSSQEHAQKEDPLLHNTPPSLITYVTHVPPLLLTIINIHMADKLMASNADEKTNVSNIFMLS